jgi:tellurite methyltransferase
MGSGGSVRFFDAQFQRQVREGDLRLNPFEERALPWLHGQVLDYGCGLGNLALAAARRGCTVLALDASPTAIHHLSQAAQAEGLAVGAREADLAGFAVQGVFDAVVSIGLLMFLACPDARRQLAQLQDHVRPGGIAVVNLLEEGTSYLDMFDPAGWCLFAAGELERHFAGWDILHAAHEDFPAPAGRVKRFATVVARKPAAAPSGDIAVL